MFILYQDQYPEDFKIGGSILNVELFRKQMTRILQQIYEKDSKQEFCPDDHWHMNVDLNIDVQSIIMHENEQVLPLNPAMNILKNIPFIISFKDRISLFRKVFIINH